MIKHKEIFLKQAVLWIDVVMVAGAFLNAYYLRHQIRFLNELNFLISGSVFEDLKRLESYLWLLSLLVLPIWIGALHFAGGYRKIRMASRLQMGVILLKATVLSLVVFGAAIFIFRLHYVSRTFMVLFSILAFVFLYLERIALTTYWGILSQQDYFQRKLLIVGTGWRAVHLIRIIENNKQWGLKIVGAVDKRWGLVGLCIGKVPIIGTLENLPQIIQEKVIDEVVFVVPRSWLEEIEDTLLQCECAGVKVTLAADLFNFHYAKAHASNLDGFPLVSYETVPDNQGQLAIKRLIDIVGSALGLLILSPLFLIVASLIKRTSPGPVFFCQTRCGLDGRKFTLYKFRTMVMDAEEQQPGLERFNEMKGPAFKLTHDPRVTPLGHWLRKSSIDELPQLFNVLKGEMSLVGPRPPIAKEVEDYKLWQRRRLSTKPGITGPWQVKGRNEIINFNTWANLDLEYIDNWSLDRDFKIMFETIPAVLFGKGAK